MLSFILTSCGFHLRGMMNMPPWLNHVAIVIEHAHRDLEPYLSDSLHAYHRTVVPSDASPRYWLIIQQDNLQQHITSVSSSTTPRQYELIYTVQFKLMQAKGIDIIPLTQITVTRQATINSDRILGSTQEEALMVNEMRRDAATQIMNRISRESSKRQFNPIVQTHAVDNVPSQVKNQPIAPSKMSTRTTH